MQSNIQEIRKSVRLTSKNQVEKERRKQKDSMYMATETWLKILLVFCVSDL